MNISSIGKDSGLGIPIETSSEQLASRKYLLKNVKVGISISESYDLSQQGYGVAHLRDVVIEVSRYILAHGGNLIYGGDMRKGGFTELILELLYYYKNDEDLGKNSRFVNFLSWPLSLNLSREDEAKYVQNVMFRKILPPNFLQLKSTSEYLIPDSIESRYVWAECLSEMRIEMEKSCDARIFVGGRNKDFQGKYPGILEELIIAIAHNKPIFLIGAFGGVVRDVLRAFNGETSTTLSDSFHLMSKGYEDLYNYVNERTPAEKISFDKCFKDLKNFGFDNLSKNNGLTAAENQRLATTPHISEMIYLILKGLTTKFQK